MLAIVFLFFLAYGPLLACCPTSNTNTVQEPGITSETSGDPMGVLDGKVLLEERDLVLQTPILGLNFIRSWRTPGNNFGVLRGGWEHSFEWKILSSSEAGIPWGTNTYQGITGEFVAVKIPVNPYDGAYKGGKYFFVKDNYQNSSSIVYKCVGQELKGATLYCLADNTWKLSNISGSKVSYLFDTGGYLTQITHPSSTSITLNYDASNRLTNVTHSCGTYLTLSYSGNYLTQVRNNRDTNLWVQYTFSNYNDGTYSKLFQATRHVSSSGTDNQIFSYYYKTFTDTNNVSQSLIAKKTTPVGDQYFWNYLSDGSLMANRAWVVADGITNNFGTTLTRQKNSQNTRMNVEIQTDRSNSAISCTTNRYDLIRMVPTRITGPLPSQTEYRSYSAKNDLTRQHFEYPGEEATLGKSYDANRNISGIYSSYGVPLSTYEGSQSDYLDYSLTWTGNRLLSEVKDACDRGYQFQYSGTQDSPIQILAINENDNIRSLAKLSYNTDGLPSRYTNANNHVTAFNYQNTAKGKKVTIQPPLGSSKSIEFDYLWRPVQWTEYDSNLIQRTTYFKTDYAGRPLAITNALNQVTEFKYDKAGRLIWAEDPAGYYLTNEWRLGKLVSQTIGKTGSSVSANISLEYDPQMTMVSVKDPDGRFVENYGLDAAGQITNVTDLDGRRLVITRGVLGKVEQIDRYASDNTYENSIYVTYDIKGRIDSVSYPDHDSNANSYHSYYCDYLPNGLLSAIYGNNGSIGLSYDTWNNLTQVVDNVEYWLYTTSNYAYDAEGNMTNKVVTFSEYPNTPLINSSYLYDANERLIGENDADGTPLWRYAYNTFSGKLEYATNMVSGIYCRYTYDELGRITDMVYSKSTRGYIGYYISYTYDNSGRIVSQSSSGGQYGISATSYEYDSLGRLEYEETSLISTNHYYCDLAGNRISTYDNLYHPYTSYQTPASNNRLSRWGNNGRMTYNSAGCVTELTRNSQTNISSLSLSWDGEYQLKEATVIDQGNNYNFVSYEYDSLGRKISRLDNDTYEYYIYDGMNLVADYDANNGRIIRTYTYGPGIDDIQSITIYDEDGYSETYYYIKDASNTVHVLVDETGLIVEYYYYDAFGNLKMRDEDYNWISESNYGNRFLFQGREYDYATALYYFRSRWYEPETGRWLSPDPIGISGGLNLYAFCNNDPVNFVDPMGEDVFFCRSWIPGGHAWVKIGGKKYNTNGDSGTSYGGYPSAMFGKPMLIYSPDEHENDWAVYYHRYKTTTVVEKQLEMWIKNTYYVEGSSKEDECERNKNPTYNLFFYNCRNFSESVEIHLNMILYSQVPMNKNNFFVLFIMPIF